MAALGAVAVVATSIAMSELAVVVVAMSVVASAVGYLGMRLLPPGKGWAAVWMACFGWFAAFFRVAGDSVLLLTFYSAVLACLITLLILSVTYMGPWAPRRS